MIQSSLNIDYKYTLFINTNREVIYNPGNKLNGYLLGEVDEELYHKIPLMREFIVRRYLSKIECVLYDIEKILDIDKQSLIYQFNVLQGIITAEVELTEDIHTPTQLEFELEKGDLLFAKEDGSVYGIVPHLGRLELLNRSLQVDYVEELSIPELKLMRLKSHSLAMYALTAIVISLIERGANVRLQSKDIMFLYDWVVEVLWWRVIGTSPHNAISSL